MTDQPLDPRLADALEEFGPGRPDLIDYEKCNAIAADILKRYDGRTLTDDDLSALAADLRQELWPNLEAAGEYPARVFVFPILREFAQRLRLKKQEAEAAESEIPFVAIGPEEIGGPIGPTHQCPGCGTRHDVITEEIVSGVKCETTGHTYLIGIKGQLITTAVKRKLRVVGIPAKNQV